MSNSPANAILLTLFALSGCAPFGPVTGPVYTQEAVTKLRLGMTTNELAQILPPPNTKAARPDADSGWVWAYGNSLHVHSMVLAITNGAVSQININPVMTHEEFIAFAKREFIRMHPDLTEQELRELDYLPIDDVIDSHTRKHQLEAEQRVREGREKRVRLESEQRAIEADIKQQAEQANQRMKYVEEHPSRPPAVLSSLLSQTIALGMTMDEVSLAWSRSPQHSTKTVTALGTMEIWEVGSAVLTFRNGLLASWTTRQ